MANDAAWQAGVDIATNKKGKGRGNLMANDAAWQAGVDIATNKKGKGKKKSQLLQQPSPSTLADPGKYASFHKGGTVKKTGNYRLRKKEVILTVAQQKAVGLKGGKKKSSVRKRVASKRG